MRRLALIAAALVALLGLAAACGGDDNATSDKTQETQPAASAQPTSDPNVYTNPQLLAETSWLSGKLSDKTVVVVDLRSKANYDAGHIQGAVWYDSSKLKDPDEKLYVIRDTLFAQYVGEIGIDSTKTVVAYDDNAGLSSARFWWVLWYYGHENAKVLNGGFPKWQKENLAVSKEPAVVTKAAFKTNINDKVVCAVDYLKEKSSKPDPNVVILDVRSAAEYTGADVRAPAVKGGHVPTAVNLDWTKSMTESDPKVWKSPAELRKQFEQAGVKPGSQVITYCQTGVRAAHSLFTLQLLGYAGSRNYDGSWAEWGSSKDTPVQQ